MGYGIINHLSFDNSFGNDDISIRRLFELQKRQGFVRALIANFISVWTAGRGDLLSIGKCFFNRMKQKLLLTTSQKCRYSGTITSSFYAATRVLD